jgi:hypothetical protein
VEENLDQAFVFNLQLLTAMIVFETFGDWAWMEYILIKQRPKDPIGPAVRIARLGCSGYIKPGLMGSGRSAGWCRLIRMPPKWAARIPPNQQVGERERLKVFANWPGGVVQDFAGNSVLAGDPECRFAGGLPLVIAGVCVPHPFSRV